MGERMTAQEPLRPHSGRLLSHIDTALPSAPEERQNAGGTVPVRSTRVLAPGSPGGTFPGARTGRVADHAVRRLSVMISVRGRARMVRPYVSDAIWFDDGTDDSHLRAELPAVLAVHVGGECGKAA
jgi:hypothetical protein